MQGYPALAVALIAAVGVALAVSYLTRKEKKGLLSHHLFLNFFTGLLLSVLSLYMCSGPPAQKPKKGPVSLVTQKKASYKLVKKEVWFRWSFLVVSI